MKISEKQLEEIRQTVDILEYIKDYVPLRKQGKSYIGLCPFHQEKTPSFHVNTEKKFFHCFGCGETGDLISFVRKYKNLSFIEAVKEVADFGGIKIDEANRVDFSKNIEQDELYELNNFAANYFTKNLFESHASESVREYLKMRKIKSQTQRTFQLGYAFPQFDAFIKTMERNNINMNKAYKLGLIDKNNRDEFYDKFRGRLIFPIHTPNGRIAGFGGRVLQKDSKYAKYLNSQESDIYSKRKLLYGFYHSKEEIRRLDKVILVEGYMDVISLYQNGIKNVVAASGTALTDDQVMFLSRYTKNIVVIFDADQAGERAAFKSIELLLKYEFNIKLLTLPNNEDPDSYIQNHSTIDFNELVSRAKDFLSYQAGKFQEKGLLDDPIERTNSIRKLVESIALVQDELMRINFLKNLAKNFSIPESILEDELNKIINKDKKKTSVQSKFSKIPDEFKKSQPTNNNISLALEKDVMKLLLSNNEEIIGEVFDYIPPEIINNREYHEIASEIYTAYMENIFSPAAILERLDDELKTIASELMLEVKLLSPKWKNVQSDQTQKGLEKFASDTIFRYQYLAIENQIKAINSEIKTNPSPERMKELMQENQELLQEKKILSDTQAHK